MWDFKAPGHVCVYGGTATGKTVFMKYLIDKYTSDKSIVHIFSTSVYQWLEYPNVYTNWSDITKVKQIAAGNKETLVILDDFNDIVDTIHDKKYIELFTRGRHLGIRVLTVAHKPTSIGKDARESLLYAITGFSSNIDYITELSRFYFGGDTAKLHKLIQQAKNYTFLVINKRTGDVFTDRATLPDDSIQSTDNQLNENADKLMGCENNMGNTVAGASTINNSGTYLDNSKNLTNFNIQNNIEVKQIYERNVVNNQIKEVNYIHAKKMERMREKDELKDLCLKLYKEKKDIERQIYLLNKFCNVSCVAHRNIEAYSKSYMEHYFPDNRYDDGEIKKIGNHYGLLKSIVDKDYSTIGSYISGYLTK
jgi:hypothetical protein